MHGNCVAYGTLVQLLLEDAPKEEYEEVRNFMVEVGLPITLKEIGCTREDAHNIALASCVEGESLHNLSGDVKVKELEDAIILQDVLGEEYLANAK